MPFGLQPHETELVGQWRLRGTDVVADDVSKRIEALTSEYLILLGTDASGWDEIYRDPHDGRLWEQTWPQAEMHGGGPPRLRILTIDEARIKYGSIVET